MNNNFNDKILYSAKEVDKLISENRAILIDVRDENLFQKGHIQGAVNLPDFFTYLSKSSPVGLERLHQKFWKIVSKTGITGNETVVFYNDGLLLQYGGACRGYWILTYLGHKNCGILHG